MRVFVINPGSTSTKLGFATVTASAQGNVFATVEKHEVQHPELRSALQGGSSPTMSLFGVPGGLSLEALEQVRAHVTEAVERWGVPDAVAARGGLIGPVAAGTYRVTPELATYSLNSPLGTHPANLAALLALEVANAHGVQAFIVDPPTIDELIPEARLTGYPGLERRSRFHALNARAVARRAANEVGKRFADATVVVAHLGGGVSVTAFERARAIDTTGALLDEGPFSATRAGSLPIEGLLDLAYAIPRLVLEERLTHESGFQGLVGTNDLRELEIREATEESVKLAVAAFVHNVAKSIGAYSAAGSRPDVIALTGGVMRWRSLAERLERRLGWIAPLIVVPGELELEALAEGVGRVLFGVEPVREWKVPG